MFPPLGARRPQSMRKVVVLPAPLGPRSPKTSPFFTVKLVSATAVKLPKRRQIPSASITRSSLPASTFGAEKCAEALRAKAAST